MILYSEIIAWIVHTSLFSFWFTGLLTDGLFDAHTNGLIQGFAPKYMSLILAGFTVNFVINGFPRLIHKKEAEQNLLFVGEFKATVLGTLNFLLQGAKIKKVIRNLVHLTGKKNVFLTKDRTTLIINNADSPKTHDYIVILFQLSLSILLLIFSPSLMVIIFMFVKYLLVLLNITPNITGAIVKTLTIVVFLHYFYPYFILSRRYSFSAIRYITKPIGNHFGYSTFSSPLLSFITSKHKLLMGVADPKKVIYIHEKYIDNLDLFNYIVAHEAGHLEDKYLNFIKVILSKWLYPWVVFIMISLGVYFNAIDNVFLGNTCKIVGVTTFILTVFTSLNIQKLGEYRADEFAVKKLGIANVKRILIELSSKSENLHISLSGTVSFSKRLERIMSKKWKN